MTNWLMGFSKKIADLVNTSLEAGTVDMQLLTGLIDDLGPKHKAELFRLAEKVEIASQYKHADTLKDYKAVINKLYSAYFNLQKIIDISEDVAKETVDRALYAAEFLEKDHKHCNATKELIRLFMYKFAEEHCNE